MDKHNRRAALTLAKIFSRMVSILRAPFHSVVFFERELLPQRGTYLERFASVLNPSIHFDFDDAIHLKYPDRVGNPVARILRLSRGVTAGNEWLAAYARRFNDHVTVVPTAVDTARFTPQGRPDVPLVWTGRSENLRFVEQIAPALRRVPGARLLVICDRPPVDLGIPVEFVPWSPEVEVEALRRGGIGIMPLPDRSWSKGKCGFKLLQYMACGIPCVASPIGVNTEILDGGDCGLLAQTEDDWVEALSRLRKDEAAARELGQRGRERAQAHYSIEAVYPRLRNALLATIAAGAAS